MIDRREFLKFLGAAAAAAAWTKVEPVEAAAQGGERVLVVGANFSLPSLDPARQFHATSQMVDHATYDPLVTFAGADLKSPKPGLAVRWAASADGKRYTFSLRPNVKFASGNPLTSRDVKWSLDRVRRLKAFPAFFLDGVEEIVAPDPQTVEIRLVEPKPGLPQILSSPSLSILDSSIVAQHGGDASVDAPSRDTAEAYLNAQSAGTGAFVLSGYVPNQEVVLLRNPRHWRGGPHLDRVVIRNIPDAATHQLMLARGDIDVTTGIRQDQVADLRGIPGVTVSASPMALTFHITMHTKPDVGGQFSNQSVREAVRYALDYDGIMKIAGPGAVRLAGVVPPSFPEALDPREAPKTDRARARTLLRDAGVAQMKVRLVYASDRIVGGIQISFLAQKIQADLAEVGIALDMDGLPIAAAIPQINGGHTPMAVWPWRADYPDASDFLPAYLPGGAVAEAAGWSDAGDPAAASLAALGRRAVSTVDVRTRIALYQEAQRRLVDIGPYIALFAPAAPYANRSTVRGLTFNTIWGLDFFRIQNTA